MAKARSRREQARGGSTNRADSEEDIGLLAAAAQDGDDEDERAEQGGAERLAGGSHRPQLQTTTTAGRSQPPQRAPSALHSPALPSESRTPRTPNRVRFDLRPTIVASPATSPHRLGNGSVNGSAGTDGSSPRDSLDSLESFGRFDVDAAPENAAHHRARLPLLTGIEAPSVALANSHDWEDEAAEADRRRPKSGLRSAFMNMANSIIGAGIIGQPYAFRQAGLLGGIVLLVGLTFMVDWTIRLIVINTKLSGAHSFQGTVERCFGRTGLIAISVAQWAFAFGGMVAFGVIVGDSIPHVLTAIWPNLASIPVLNLLSDRRTVIVVFTLGVSYPLTLYRDIAKLAKASTLALFSMGIIVLTVIVEGALTPREARGSFSPALLTVNSGITQAIGVISFAFVCHHNSLLIYGSLETPTIDRFSRVTHYSTGVSMLACLLVALAGFLTFGDKTLGNVLNNFPSDNTMVTVARLCFGLNMLTTLPLEAFVCREVMLNYYFPGEPFNMNLHLIFSSALVVSAMALSLLTCDLGIIFELVGSTSACAIAYILPPLCYIKLSTRSWRTYLAWTIVAFGSAVMAITMLQSVAKIISGDGGPAMCM